MHLRQKELLEPRGMIELEGRLPQQVFLPNSHPEGDSTVVVQVRVLVQAAVQCGMSAYNLVAAVGRSFAAGERVPYQVFGEAFRIRFCVPL